MEHIIHQKDTQKKDPKGHTEAITEIVQEGLPGVPGMRLRMKTIIIS